MSISARDEDGDGDSFIVHSPGIDVAFLVARLGWEHETQSIFSIRLSDGRVAFLRGRGDAGAVR